LHTETLDLREVLVFLAAAGLIVPLMQRFRINPVIGFLAVGCVISPSGIGGSWSPCRTSPRS
jgi:CPA2 family monovalent cation:H+ antiporter-2